MQPQPRPATTRAPAPKRHRVSNSVGLLILGSSRTRTLVVVDCPTLRSLAQSDDLWTAARENAVKVVLGVVDIAPREARYVVTSAVCRAGYHHMMRELASGVTSRDGVGRLDFLGQSVRPRFWAPFLGVRRRGRKALGAIKRRPDVSEAYAEQLVELIKTNFVDFVGRARASRPS